MGDLLYKIILPRGLTICLPITYPSELSRHTIFSLYSARMCKPTSKSCLLLTVPIHSMTYNCCFVLNECNSYNNAETSFNIQILQILQMYSSCLTIFFLSSTLLYFYIYPRLLLSCLAASEMKAWKMVTVAYSRQRTGCMLYCALDPFQQSEGNTLMSHDTD